MAHLWRKLNSKPKDWRKIYKTLTVFEYLIKNGAPRCVQDIKDELFKVRSFSDFSYSEGGVEKGQGIRDKARMIVDLLSDPNKL